MRRRFEAFATAEGVARGLAYQPEPSDVFITPFSKSGTTWLQQIAHGVRTGGSMDFDEITRVVPWLEMAHDLGLALTPQIARPNLFKSHLSWEEIPNGGRYIVSLRDPLDACLSLHRFMDGWFLEAGAVSLDDFARHFLEREEGAGAYWAHAASWWRQRGRDDVLLMCFEDIKADLAATVDRVAAFIGCPIGGAERARVIEQSGFAFMKRYAGQFDDHLVREARDAACGLPPGGDSSKVSRGVVGGAAELLGPDIVAAFDARWRETLGAEFGLAGYAALRAALSSWDRPADRRR